MSVASAEHWRLVYTTPAGRTLGLQAGVRDDAGCSMICPPSSAALDVDGQVHRGAIIVLLDQCMGSAAAGATLGPLITLDLRTDWLNPAIPGQAVRCRTSSVERIATVAHVVAQVDHGDGTPTIAQGTGRFLFGQVAGGHKDRTAPPAIELGDAIWNGFEAYLGLEGSKGRFRLPRAPRLTGSTYLPALHGGITGAALAEAMTQFCADDERTCNHRLITVTTEFLLAGKAKEDLIIATQFVRAGKKVAIVEATSYQNGSDSPVALARGMFVRS